MKLGIQSYSLRKFSFEEAVKTASELGLKYIEAFPEHLPPKIEEVEALKELEEKYGVKVVAHGVNHMPNKEEELRSLFEFAKEAGIEVLTADPDPDAMSLIDKLVKEYGVKVAIHNHGPGHRYARVEDVLKAVGDYSVLIGMCLDTGHLTRAEEDVVEAVSALGPRLHGVHLKDINEAKKDVVIGEGIVDFKEFFKALKEASLIETCVMVIEYEPEPENPIQGIRKSLENVRRILEEIV